MRQIIFSILFTFVSSSLVLAKMNPKIKWKKITTPHFEVVFNKKDERLAQRYAAYAEQAYDYLIPIFKEAPKKTVIVIDDSTDTSNGSATYLPYPKITIFPTLPMPTSAVSDYDYRGLDLLIHEYAHILSFYPAHGVYTPLKYIFGSTVTPLGVLPRWHLEGLAVAMESRFTNSGRLKSTYNQSIFRAYLLDKKLDNISIDKINDTFGEWPGGSTPYIWGSLLWQKIINENGEDSVYRILQDASRRLPFRVNASFKKTIKKTGQELLSEAYLEAEANFTPLPSKARPLDVAPKTQVHDFKLSPNKKHMLSLQRKKGSALRLLLHSREKDLSFNLKKGQVIATGGRIQRFGWSQDSGSIVYDKQGSFKRKKTPYQRYGLFYNLFSYNLEKKKSTLLQSPERSFHPDLSPNNENLVFIKNQPGRHELLLANVDGTNSKVIYRPPLEIRLSYPTFINDEEVLVLVRDYEGVQKVYRINVLTKKKSLIRLPNNKLTKVKKTGKSYLFIGEDDLTKKLYASSKSFTNLKAVHSTNTATINGEWDPLGKRIYLAELSSTGAKPFVLPQKFAFKEESKKPASKVIDYKWPEQPMDAPNLDIKSEVKNYSSLKYLIPRYWVPFGFMTEDGFVVQGSTSAYDPLNRHQIDITGGYDTITKEPSYSLSYTNRVTPINFSLGYSIANEPIPGTPLSYQHMLAYLGTSSYIYGLSNKWRMGLSGAFQQTRLNGGTGSIKLAGPSAFFSYSGGGPKGQGLLGTTLRHSHYIDTENFFNYDMTRLTSTYNFNHYLPSRHNLVFKLNGAYSSNLPNGALGIYGAKTIGGNFVGNLINGSVLMRGYPSGNFASQEMGVASLSYGFPLISEIYSGPGLFPVFFKNVNTNFFIDAGSFKGRYFGKSENETEISAKLTDHDEIFLGYGVEFSLKTTLGYHLPVDFILGLYYGDNVEAQGGFTPFFSLTYSTLADFSKNKGRKYKPVPGPNF